MAFLIPPSAKSMDTGDMWGSVVKGSAVVPAPAANTVIWLETAIMTPNTKHEIFFLKFFKSNTPQNKFSISLWRMERLSL